MSVPNEVQTLLKDQRFGITFPCKSGCQMRFIHNGEDLGGYFAYRQWGGLRKAVEAAISRNHQLRVIHKRQGRTGKAKFRKNAKARSNTGVIGVYGSRYYDERRAKHYFRYLVRWSDTKGKGRIKTFNLTEPYTADQQVHTFRSATHFRKAWENELEDFDHIRFKLWRQKRLYHPGQPDLPADFWEIREDLERAG